MEWLSALSSLAGSSGGQSSNKNIVTPISINSVGLDLSQVTANDGGLRDKGLLQPITSYAGAGVTGIVTGQTAGVPNILLIGAAVIIYLLYR